MNAIRCLVRLVLAVTLCAALPAAAATALVGGNVVDIRSGDTIEDAVVLVDGERISAVGARDEVAVPDDATVIDASDKTVFPGLVCPVTRICPSPARGGGPASHANYRVVDELYPHQHAYERLCALLNDLPVTLERNGHSYRVRFGC